MEFFRKYLEDAGYPSYWIKDTPMDDILSKPGTKRLYTLKWCLSKFDEHIEKHLDVQDDMLEAALWEAVTKMLLICTDRKEDREIFNGNGKCADQIEFWKKIFHIVNLSRLHEQPHDIDPQIDTNIVEQFKPREPLNLIPVELKMASSDLVTSADQLLDKRLEIENELELLRAENKTYPPQLPTAELSLNADVAKATDEDINSKREALQTSITNFRSVYASKLERLVEQSDSSIRPSTSNDDVLYGAASKLLSELSEVNAIHERFMKMRDEYLQFMRQKTKSLRASVENGENKLKELRMMVSALDELDVE